jgi:hypothetical protein
MAYSLIRPKSQNSNIRHDGILVIRNLMLMLKNSMGSNFEPLMAMIRAKSQNSNIRHDGALSIRNFPLNQAQQIISHACQLTNNQKMCSLLPWYMEFPIFIFELNRKGFSFDFDCQMGWLKFIDFC